MSGTYPGFLRDLYLESGAEGMGLSFPDFAESLTQFHGSDRRPDYYRQVHLQDLALAQACCHGSIPGWELFWRRYRERLYAAALILTRCQSAARDLADSLAADLFVSDDRRKSRLASYTGRGALEGWLKAVLSRAYVDRYRSDRRTVGFDDQLSSAQSDLGFSEVIDLRLTDAIRQSFDVLQAEERYLLAAYYFDRRTLAAIGATLGVHESTVNRRLIRLIRALRTHIKRVLREKGMSERQVEEWLSTDVRDLSLDLRRQLVRE